ncbi:diguanylate cyclase [Marimonas lutisalis]|uniref:diguanylate cyclase n=1 Tax=Marimonas lutisalis TaxID=2545756 RepID=UPI0010F81E18|nr:diguanylate cyclase [Marimonas lutisalis]
MPGKVLIIDDIATNRVMLKVKLAAACYRVVQASSAQDGLTAARAARPDIILTPARLGDMPLAALVKALRDDPDLAQTPVLVVTSDPDRASRLSLLAAGVDDVLVKPLSDDLLLARLRALLRQRETTEELRLREGARRVLGLAEAGERFDSPGTVMLVSGSADSAGRWAGALAPMLQDRLVPVACDQVIARLGQGLRPDAIALELGIDAPGAGLRLLADLTSQPGTREAGIIVALSGADARLGAEALDRGAIEVMGDGSNTRELALRLRRQVLRKRRIDSLRASMRDGLRAAVTDPLTGLYNRRYAMPRLARLADQAAETGRDYAVMVVDLDHFKLINDRFGHAAGDAVLARVATVLRDAMREEDLVARLGGEEFLIAMPDTGRHAAHMAAQRLCRRLAATGFDLPGQPRPIRITASIGVTLASDAPAPGMARAHPDPMAPEAMLDRADRALYAAKSHGRNQVTLCTRRPAA